MTEQSDPSHEVEANIWDLVFGGNRELVWASQLFYGVSVFLNYRRIPFVNCEDPAQEVLSKSSLPPAL